MTRSRARHFMLVAPADLLECHPSPLRPELEIMPSHGPGFEFVRVNHCQYGHSGWISQRGVLKTLRHFICPENFSSETNRQTGVMVVLAPCPDDSVAPFLGLRVRHGQAPYARPPPAPKLPQPRVDLVHVAPPTAIRSGCICGSKLECATLEVSPLVRYGGDSAAFQEQGNEWCPP